MNVLLCVIFKGEYTDGKLKDAVESGHPGEATEALYIICLSTAYALFIVSSISLVTHLLKHGPLTQRKRLREHLGREHELKAGRSQYYICPYKVIINNLTGSSRGDHHSTRHRHQHGAFRRPKRCCRGPFIPRIARRRGDSAPS